MPNLRPPRLVKTAKAIHRPALVATPKQIKKHLISELRILGTLTYYQHRVRKLQLFEAHLKHSPEQWARRVEVMPRYRAMIQARTIRSRPLPDHHRQWLFAVTLSLASRELFRLEYRQHCESVIWSPDDIA